MPQTAIKGIYRDGKIIPLEEVPVHDTMEVIIVFTDNYYDDESRYYKPDWKLAEKQASEDYKAGNIKSSDSLDEMFDDIEKGINEN
jgi:hypothetical protein